MQHLNHFHKFIANNDHVNSVFQTIHHLHIDAEIRQSITKSLLDTPLGPHENVLNIVTQYYDSLKEREHKL